MSSLIGKREAEVFYKIYLGLLAFINRQIKIVKARLFVPDDFATVTLEEREKLSSALYNRKEYIDQFLQDESSQDLSSDEVAIASSWKHFEKGEFILYKHLKKHSIFLQDSAEGKTFAVAGFYRPLEEIFPCTPIIVETTLLPFRDRIIYDGIIRSYPVHFGPGICSRIRESYEEKKHRFGLVTQLPWVKGPHKKIKNEHNFTWITK